VANTFNELDMIVTYGSFFWNLLDSELMDPGKEKPI